MKTTGWRLSYPNHHDDLDGLGGGGMRDPEAGADRRRDWAHRLRATTVAAVVAAATVLPFVPVGSAAASELAVEPAPQDDTAVQDSTAVHDNTAVQDSTAVHDNTAVQDDTAVAHAPLPDIAGAEDADASAPAGQQTGKACGTPAEVTTLTLAGGVVLPDITTTQAPPQAPVGTGHTRAPPVRTAH